MADVDGAGGEAGGSSRLVETIAANLDSAWAEVQQSRSNDQHAWMAWAQKMAADETDAAAEAKGHARRDENWAESKSHWGGIKAAEHSQRSEDATFRETLSASRSSRR